MIDWLHSHLPHFLRPASKHAARPHRWPYRWANRWVGLIAIMALSAGFATAAELEPHRAFYDVRIKVFKGSMVTELQAADGAAYTGTSEITPRGFARLASKGTIENQSLFRLTDSGVQPLAFQGSDTISKRKKHANLNFDWDSLRLTGTASQKKSGKRIETAVDAPMENGLHDAISLQYALMHDLQQDDLKDRYTLADGDQLKTINITRLETTSLRVPYGEFNVVPVQHQVEGSSRVTTFWFARELNFLPVKIEQHRKGKRLMKAELGDYQLAGDVLGE